MLHYLELTNYKRHRAFNVEFVPGLNAICGPNWSGKSTLFSAILYALYGARAVDARTDQLTTDGEKGLEVRLEFSAAGERFLSVRTLATATLHQLMAPHSTWEVKATGHAAVTAEIEELIGKPVRDFRAFNLIRSKDAASVLTMGPAKLGEHIDRVSGVDLVDRVLERIKGEAPRVEGALAALTPLIMDSATVEKLEAEVHDGKEERRALGSQHDLLRTQFANETAALAHRSAELESAQGQQKMADESAVARDTAARALAAAEGGLQEELAKEPNAVEVASVEELRVQFELLKRQHAEYLSRGQLDRQMQADLLQAEQALAQLDKQLIELGNSATEESIELEEARYAEAQAAAGGLAEALKQAEELLRSAVCPTCRRAFDDMNPEAIGAQVESLRADLAVEQSKLADLYRSLENRRKTLQEKTRLQDNRSAWQERFSQLSAELQKQLAEPEIQIVTEAALQNAQSSWHRARQEAAAREQWQRAVDWAQQAVANAKLALDAIRPVYGPGHDVVAELRRQVQDLQVQKDETYGKLSSTAQAIALIEQAQSARERALADQESLRREYDRAKVRSMKLSALAKFLRGNRDRYTASVWESLLGYASEFVAGATAGSVTHLSRGDGGGFLFVEDGQTREVEGSASDLQEAIFGTAIRLAMGDALGGHFETMLLDEVTAPARDDMSLLFTSQLKQLGRQVLLITHRPADAAVADLVIELES